MELIILNKILENTYTLLELRKRLRVLRIFLTLKFFGNPDDLDEKLRQQLNASDISWLESLDGDFISEFNKDNIYQIFTKIEQTINQSSVLNIYLPFEVNTRIDSAIGQFIRQVFGRVILFDIKFDPSLIAGCALSWQGIYRDYSLRKRIQDHKGVLMQNFKKYLHKL